MESGSLIGALAIFTISSFVLIGIVMLLRHNSDPKNMDASKAVLNDESSATTGVRGGGSPNRGQMS